MIKHYAIFDISNMLHRTFFANKGESDETQAGLATHTALVTLNKYFKKYRPDVVVMAFDRKSWRKAYTASDLCLSKKLYKGNRRQDMTPSEQAKYQRFLEHISEFESLVSEHTTIVTLTKDGLEADDLMGGFCQRMSGRPDVRITLFSTDSDMLQLLKHDNVTIVSPDTDEVQTLSEYDGDAELYLFTKCIRGDRTDNIQSAYPRVHTKKIREAYTDEFARVQLMKSTWTNQDSVEFVVEDLFRENQLLIDLEQQPPEIRRVIETTIDDALAKKRAFSFFHLMKFIGKYKLVRIREQIDQYLPLLSN